MSEKAQMTPGPWRAHRLNAPGRHWDGFYEIHFNSEGECVAETVYVAADAHLIAAAPDLLTACKALQLAHMPGRSRDLVEKLLGPDAADAYDRGEAVFGRWINVLVEAAITKAEGQG